RFCPDYEIKQWSEKIYDVNKIQYTKEAYVKKRYAFVTDVARLDIIYSEGGIYLDTDVELIKPLDDLLVNQAYMGMETAGRVNTGQGF
ncbi:glycosyltransferase family 32 protein, partial [Klebsiella quasipneumoniae]|uniref:glycosyltransferase family 32 protein n=1 Tax=Klebsiella quasipneumoniae TaxID=1463165 RepID=UPI00272F0F0D